MALRPRRPRLAMKRLQSARTGPNFQEGFLPLSQSREVPNGVGADGVGVKFPIFPVNCSRLPLFQENRQKTKKNEEKRRKTQKKQRNRKKTKKRRKKRKSEEKRKKWENSSDPIYTNAIKNLPPKDPFILKIDLWATPKSLAASDFLRPAK